MKKEEKSTKRPPYITKMVRWSAFAFVMAFASCQGCEDCSGTPSGPIGNFEVDPNEVERTLDSPGFSVDVKIDPDILLPEEEVIAEVIFRVAYEPDEGIVSRIDALDVDFDSRAHSGTSDRLYVERLDEENGGYVPDEYESDEIRYQGALSNTEFTTTLNYRCLREGQVVLRYEALLRLNYEVDGLILPRNLELGTDLDPQSTLITCNNGDVVCGNSETEAGEECDDGNTTSGDGCDENCQLESEGCEAPPPGIAAWTDDETGTFIDSLSTIIPELSLSWIDITRHGARVIDMTNCQAMYWFNDSLYECGTTTDVGQVVCPTGVEDMPEDELLIVQLQFDGEIPPEDLEHSYIYSLVLDSNDITEDNWVYHAPYDWDYFQGADRWYQLMYSHETTSWDVTATQVSTSQNTAYIDSSVRAVIDGDSITWFVSMSEFESTNPSYRVTSFVHDGAWTQETRAGDVNGADPTEALTPVRGE